MRKTLLKKAVVLAMAVMMFGSVLTAQAENGVYTVKRGDNLHKIAKEVYGDAEKWNVIYEANRDQIKDPNKIWAKQNLVTPDAVNVTPSDTAAPAVPVAVDASTFLPNVYNLMAAQDYASLSAVYNSEAAKAYVNAMTEDRAVYIPEGGLTGKGAEVIKDGYGNYYFYYGDYVDGVKNGNGTWFINIPEYTNIFTGTWSNGVPNGQGTESRLFSNGEVRIFSGNLVNGLWHGNVNYTLTTAEGQYSMSFVADNGVAADRTEELMSHFSYFMEMGGYTRDTIVSADEIIFAFAGEVEWTFNGVEQYDTETAIWIKCAPDKHFGVPGWEY